MPLAARARQPLRAVMALTGFAGPLLLIFGSGVWRWIGLAALVIAGVLAFLDGYTGRSQD